MPIDATVKGSASNSFATQVEADAYFLEERLFDDEWVASTMAVKEAALRWSTRVLSEAVDWYGSPTTTTQALPWPRAGIVDVYNKQYVSEHVIPGFIKRIQFDLALELIKRNRTQEPGLIGNAIGAASLGDLSVTVNKNDLPALIPASLMVSIAPYGELTGAARVGARNIPIARA